MQNYSKVFRFGHELLIETRVGHSNLHLFLIDTGTFGNSISPRVAREAFKGPEDNSVEVRGVTGKAKQPPSFDRLNVQFGHLQQEQRDTVASDHSGLSRVMGTEIGGILGLKMLSLLDIKIDYRDGLVDFAYDPRRVRTR